MFDAFADVFLEDLSEAELGQFEALLEAPDQDVFAWLQGKTAVPANFDTPVFRQLKTFCTRENPKWNV